jgi:2-oxoglutarate ferredoxin oxidoreductase subunit gamma
MKILLAGEGGQGVQLAAEILAKSAFLENQGASLIPNFGVEQRGGVSLAFVIIGKQIFYPKFNQAEVAAIFCDRAKNRVKGLLGPQTKIIYGPAVTGQPPNPLPSKVWNIVVLKKIIDLTKIVKKETVWQVLQEKLRTGITADPSLRQANWEALQ